MKTLTRNSLATLMATTALAFAPAQAYDFNQDLAAARAACEKVGEENRARLAEGELAEATKAWLDALPEEKRSAAQCLALGDVLFPIDAAQSSKLHEKALALAGDEPLVMSAWARELHRARKYAEAEKLYATMVTKGHPDVLVLHGLHADCLMHLGRIEEAIAAWDAARATQSHVDIEKSARAIYGGPGLDVQRCGMLQAIQGGDLSKLEPLLLLDLSWERFGEAMISNRKYVTHDRALGASLLGKDTRRYRELDYLVAARLANEPRAPASPESTPGPAEDPSGLGPSPIERGGRQLGLVGYGEKHLPYDSRVTAGAFELLFMDGAVIASEFIEWFGKELTERAKSKDGDVEACELLCRLYADAKLKEKAAELDALGWERYKDARFAVRLLAARGDKLESSDPVLKTALETPPGDGRILSFAIDCARREKKPLAELLQRKILAGFADMKSFKETHEAFAQLKTELAKKDK